MTHWHAAAVGLLVWVMAVFAAATAGARAAAPQPAAVPPNESFPARTLTDRTFERTPQRLARGQYLVEHVAHCFLCHSENDWKNGGQPKRDTKGAGRNWGDYDNLTWLNSPNITPDPETGAGKWTDDMFARAIREGIGHDGRPLFLMPWREFRHLSDEDLASVIVYVRSIPAVKRPRPTTELPPPIRTTLQPEALTSPVPEPDMSTPVARGTYLTTIGQCAGCHSAYDEKNEPLPGLKFGGGLPLKGNWGDVTTANITRDPSGLAHYTETLFLKTIRTGKFATKPLNPIMPWGYFRGMTDEDLKAIWAFLGTVPPVQHRVSNLERPTSCKVCGKKHGRGEFNH